MQNLASSGEQRLRTLDQAAAADLTEGMGQLVRRLTAQIEKAGADAMAKPARPRRALQVVADAAAEE